MLKLEPCSACNVSVEVSAAGYQTKVVYLEDSDLNGVIEVELVLEAAETYDVPKSGYVILAAFGIIVGVAAIVSMMKKKMQ